MPGTVTLTINGEPAELSVDPETPHGTVVPAFNTPLWSVAGKSVVTVEGLADESGLHPV